MDDWISLLNCGYIIKESAIVLDKRTSLTYGDVKTALSYNIDIVITEGDRAALFTRHDRCRFIKLIDALNQIGYKLTCHYDIRTGMAMLQTAKEIRIDRYEHLFLSDEPQENDGDMIKINQFLSELIPYINSVNMPDLKNLAAKHGIDP